MASVVEFLEQDQEYIFTQKQVLENHLTFIDFQMSAQIRLPKNLFNF